MSEHDLNLHHIVGNAGLSACSVTLTQLITHRTNILILQWANKDVVAVTIALLLYGTADQPCVSSDKQLASAATAVVDSRARQPVPHEALVCVFTSVVDVCLKQSARLVLKVFSCGFYLWTASCEASCSDVMNMFLNPSRKQNWEQWCRNIKFRNPHFEFFLF